MFDGILFDFSVDPNLRQRLVFSAYPKSNHINIITMAFCCLLQGKRQA